MAILITARKTDENAEQVKYEFGLDEQFDRIMTIDKVTGDVVPADGNLDSIAGMMSVKIKKISRATGEFPPGAVYAA